MNTARRVKDIAKNMYCACYNMARSTNYIFSPYTMGKILPFRYCDFYNNPRICPELTL